MSIADKLQIILENEQKVYNAGYEKGKNEGGGSAPAVLEELTITRNGVYEPDVKVELGGTYAFRNDYTEDELTEFRNNNVYCEIVGAEIWTDEFYTDSGEHCHLLWYVDYNLDIGYVYLSKNAIMLGASDLETNAEPGWYRRGTTERVDSLTITIPQNQEDIFSDLSILTPLFEPSSDGFNKVNVNVEPELKELTVTQNGTYKSGEKIELGETYLFKASYTNDELKEIYNVAGGGYLFEEDNYGVYLAPNEDYSLFTMEYESHDGSFGYSYIPEEAYASDPSWFPASGWVDHFSGAKIGAPTVTLSTDPSYIYMNLSALASLVFGLNVCDGFDTVIVDVKGDTADISLGELTVTQNGIYTPGGDASPKINGIYQFKDDFSGVDFSALAVGEPTDQDLGWWLSSNIYYTWTEQGDVGHVDVLYINMGSRDNYYWVSAGPVMISTQDGFVTIPSAGWWIVSYGDYMRAPIAPNGVIFSSNKNDNIPVEAMLALFKDGVPEGEYAFKDVPNRPVIYQTVLGCGGEWTIPDILVDGYPVRGSVNTWITNNTIAGVSFSVSGNIYPEVMYVYTSIPYYQLNNPGWYALDEQTGAYLPCETPTKKFPVRIMEMASGEMSQTMLYDFFEVPKIDGFDRVEVNVPVGTDTSDATATEETILDGFSAYVNGEKVVGTKTFNLQEKTVKTKQSTVVPDEGYDGLSKVDINIEGELKITDNGTQDVTNYASVSVEVEKGVFPEGELAVTENGVHDVTNYASVSVKVAGATGENLLQTFIEKRGMEKLYNYIKSDDPEILDCLAAVDTSKVTTTNSMFSYSSLACNSIPVFDVSGVTDASYMFAYAEWMTTIPALYFKQPCNALGMFDCDGSETVPLTEVNIIMEDCIDATYMFRYRKALRHYPNTINTHNCTSFTRMFDSCKKLGGNVSLDVASCKNLTSTFDGAAQATDEPLIVELLNSGNVISFTGTFRNAYRLSTVSADLRSATNTSSMFAGCSDLANLTLKNIKTSLAVSDAGGTKLTVDSLIGLCYELRDTGVVQTLTIKSTNLEKLANVYVRSIEITEEMRAEDDLIDEKLPFEVCESTDEGAMLIRDYVQTKNWTLA
jgi:hypothetical protein